jgi:hypothetical protein
VDNDQNPFRPDFPNIKFKSIFPLCDIYRSAVSFVTPENEVMMCQTWLANDTHLIISKD